MIASKRKNLDAVERLTEFHKNQIRIGFKSYNQLTYKFSYIYDEIIELIIKFTI